ncbi:unnamed protein product [Rotaria sordida]|uniref:Uncharacterized protein n=1 Tax=Rotaria sordida TaxID=392033 RepID=A0A815QEL3_9BILA|nr:unnamed protein product [Rotaria sordida]
MQLSKQELNNLLQLANMKIVEQETIIDKYADDYRNHYDKIISIFHYIMIEQGFLVQYEHSTSEILDWKFVNGHFYITYTKAEFTIQSDIYLEKSLFLVNFFNINAFSIILELKELITDNGILKNVPELITYFQNEIKALSQEMKMKNDDQTTRVNHDHQCKYSKAYSYEKINNSYQNRIINPPQHYQCQSTNVFKQNYYVNENHDKPQVYQRQPTNHLEQHYSVSESYDKPQVYQCLPTNLFEQHYNVSESHDKSQIYQYEPTNLLKQHYSVSENHHIPKVYQYEPTNLLEQHYNVNESHDKPKVYQYEPTNLLEQHYNVSESHDKPQIYQYEPTNLLEQHYSVSENHHIPKVYQYEPTNLLQQNYNVNASRDTPQVYQCQPNVFQQHYNHSHTHNERIDDQCEQTNLNYPAFLFEDTHDSQVNENTYINCHHDTTNE